MDQQEIHWVTVGCVGRVYGIQGWVKIISYTEPTANILRFKPWYLFLNQAWHNITVTHCKTMGKALAAKFAEVNNPEQAKSYVNAKIGIQRQQLPVLPEGEYYWTDLTGLTVFNTLGHYLGVVDRLFATGANDVVVVKHENQEIWLPYLPKKVILKIDLSAKNMLVDWDHDI